jgi:hypothetical protein
MLKTFAILACFFVVVLTVGVGFVAYDLDRGIRSVDATAKHFDEFVTDASLDYAVKAEQMNHILLAARITADQAGLLAIEQRRQLNKTSLDSDKTVKALRIVIDRGGLFFKHADEELATNSSQMQDSVRRIGLSADSITSAGDALTRTISDPQIPQLLGHFNTISGNLEVVSANSAAMSGDMKLAVHRLAQPPTKLHQVLNVSWTAAKFGSLFIP